MSATIPGTRFGPHELISPAGAGGMGEVWKARDTRVDRFVAIKISQRQFSERFEREVMALGAPDSAGMLFNHFNQYGITDSEGWGRPRDRSVFPGPEGFVNYVLDPDYRYLNLGFRFANTAGSASGVLQGPVGYNRVYVKLDGPLTAERWFRALKNGGSFFTNGPMLFTDFRKLGAKVAVGIDLRSRDPLGRIEVIANGRVIENVRPDPGARNVRGTLTVEARNHSWMAVRCWQKDVPSIRLAHSMPLYLDGRWDASGDACYFVNWMDELIDITKRDGQRFRLAAQRDEVLAVYRQAREVHVVERTQRRSSPIFQARHMAIFAIQPRRAASKQPYPRKYTITLGQCTSACLRKAQVKKEGRFETS